MTYIAYSKTKKIFYATSKRPSNQGKYDNLVKIAERLKSYVVNHEETELTKLQKKFTAHLEELEKDYKRADDFIDIAHGIAIHAIIEYFVYMLNRPKKLDIKKTTAFIDDICSSESDEDDKGRGVVQAFLQAIKDGSLDTEKLLEKANNIILMLNRCTRNLNIGDASTNRAIQSKEDPSVVAVKGKDEVKLCDHYKKIKKSFDKIYDGYLAHTAKHTDGKTLIMSSSAPGNRKGHRAYFEKAANADGAHVVHVLPLVSKKKKTR